MTDGAVARGILILMAFTLSGCTTVSFLAQAGTGQLSLQSSAKPLHKAIADQRTSPEHAALLAKVPEMKAYGQANGLTPTTSFERYVNVDGDAVVWVVTACPEFSLAPRTWSFPIVGSFSYLGWFKKERAEAHAERLRNKGFDVDIRGASAYSTLGWFRDPIYSTMLRGDDLAEVILVETILHESLHATIYVNDQSYFNESLAQFVGEGLALQYLEEQHGADAETVVRYRRWLDYRKQAAVRKLEAWEALRDLYRQGGPAEEVRAQKRAILEALRDDLNLSETPNNASLAGSRTYESGTEAFMRLFEQSGRDWPAFLQHLAQLQPSDFPKKQQADFGAVVDAIEDWRP